MWSMGAPQLGQTAAVFGAPVLSSPRCSSFSPAAAPCRSSAGSSAGIRCWCRSKRVGRPTSSTTPTTIRSSSTMTSRSIHSSSSSIRTTNWSFPSTTSLKSWSESSGRHQDERSPRTIPGARGGMQRVSRGLRHVVGELVHVVSAPWQHFRENRPDLGEGIDQGLGSMVRRPELESLSKLLERFSGNALVGSHARSSFVHRHEHQDPRSMPRSVDSAIGERCAGCEIDGRVNRVSAR